MGFGINNTVKNLNLKTIYRRYKRYRDLKKITGNNIQLPLEYDIRNSNFGSNIYLGNKVSLTDSFINDYSYINKETEVRNTKIGKFCSIGPNVKIVLGSHPVDFISTSPMFYSNKKNFKTFADDIYITEIKGVSIGHDVWIAEGVLIPGGISIGNGAVITARAVVTKDVEPYSIVGGVPAKHIKFRFKQDVIEEIEKSKWWDWTEDLLKEKFKSFHSKESFLEYLNKKNND